MAEALIGPYRPTLRLSADAESERWAAWDTRLNRRVELTVLPRLARDSEEGPKLFKGFVQELRKLVALRHPNLQTPQEFAPLHEAQAWYVTEPLQAISLRTFLEAVPRLPWTLGALVAREVAEALAFAHGRDVVHGNVRPDAVLLEQRGRVKVARFAIPLVVIFRQNVAAFEGLDGVSDERRYLAPEVLRLREPDARSDLFSLGVLAYEMVTGQHPFASEEALRDYGESMSNQPPDPWAVAGHIPQALRDLIRELLVSAPKRRPASMEAVSERLGTLLASEGIRDVGAELERSFARQASVFDPEHADDEGEEATRVIEAVDDPSGIRRPRTQPMRRLSAGDDGKRTRPKTQPMGPVRRAKTQPMRMLKLSPDGTVDDADPEAGQGPKRSKTTTRFEAVGDEESAAAERAREGAAHDEAAPAAAAAPSPEASAPVATSRAGGQANVLRILEREGYLKKRPKREVDESRAAIWLMIAIAGLVAGLYFVIERGSRDDGVAAEPVAGEARPAARRPPPTTVEDLEAEGVNVAKPPTDDPRELKVERAEAMLEAGNPALAEREARQGLELAERDPRLHMALGKALAGQGKVDEAVVALTGADEHRGARDEAVGHVAAAQLLEREKRWADALKLYDQAYQRGLESAALFRSMAQCHLELGQRREAEAALERFVALEPGQVEELLVLAELKERHGKVDAAGGLYRAVLRLEPGNTKATVGLTRLAARSSSPEAAAELVSAGSAEPDQLAAAGDGAFKARQYTKAAELFARAIAARGEEAPAWLLLNHAKALDRAGREVAAIKAYRRALAKDPRNAEGHFMYGQVLARYGRTGDAIAAYERAVKADRRHWQGAFEAGVLQLQGSRWRDAADAFQRVLKRQPGHAGALQNLAKAQFEGGDRAGAVETFQRLARVRPADPTPLLTAAGLLKMMRRPDEAAAALAEACRRGARQACQ